MIEFLKSLIKFLQDALSVFVHGHGDSRNAKVLKKAWGEIGTKEIPGTGNNPDIVKYHRYASKNNDEDKPDSVPWCASFVCYILEAVGMQSTNSRMARSYERWGKSSKKSPLPGDIVVFWRGSKTATTGHVGFWIDETESYIYVLGGNQNDEVNVSRISKSKLLDIRRSSKDYDLDESKQKTLFSMAKQIRSGVEVPVAGNLG